MRGNVDTVHIKELIVMESRHPADYGKIETSKEGGYMPEENIFSKLNSINVNSFTEKKGNFTYLSWAWAVRELLQVDPKATWEVHKWGGDDDINSRPYMETDAGFFVQVTVTVDGVDRTQVHPVLDNRNQAIEKPNAFQINTSIQRCLAKAIALHGLGLYIYAGEDLPHEDPLTSNEESQLLMTAASVSKEMEDQVAASLKDGVINRSNYDGSLAKLRRIAKESKDEKSK